MTIKDIIPILEAHRVYIEKLDKEILNPIRTFDMSIPGIPRQARKSSKGNSRKLTYDMISSELVSYNRNVEDYFLRRIASGIAYNLAFYVLQDVDRETMQLLLDTAGYTAESMEEFIINNTDMNLDKLPSPLSAGIVYLEYRLLFDAFCKRNYDKLRAVDRILKEKGIISEWIRNEVSEWNSFVLEHSALCMEYYILKRTSSILRRITDEKSKRLSSIRSKLLTEEMNKLCLSHPELMGDMMMSLNEVDLVKKLSKCIPVENMERVLDITNRQSKLLDLQEDALCRIDELLEEVRSRKDELVRDEYVEGISEGCYQSIIDGDDTVYIPLMTYVWEDFWAVSTIPMSTDAYLELEDEEEWDYFLPETNGKLASCVYDENETMDIEVFDEGYDDDFDLKVMKKSVPIATVLAYYTNNCIPPLMYLRRSHIKMFRKAGLSERRARDLAVVIATLNARSELTHDRKAENFVKRLYPHTANTETSLKTVVEKPEERDILDKTIEEKYEERIRELERKLKNAESEKKDYRHQILQLQKENESLKGEKVSEYRDTEVEEESPCYDSDTSTESSVIFPYHTERKIMLYGGFDVFHKELKKLIPEIRIIPSTYKAPDPEPFRQSDVVFLQTNRMNHSNYWAARDASRNSGVPCYHLNFSSARKCADFIVRTLSELNGPNENISKEPEGK